MKKLNRNLLVVLISVMVGMIYFIPYIRFTFYDQTIVAFNLSNYQLGQLGSIYGLVALFCYPISGILTGRFSPRILLTTAFLGTAVMTFWHMTSPSFGVLIVIYIFFAFFTTATLWSPYITVLRGLGSEEEQGKLFGSSEAIRGVATTVGGFFFLWVLGLFVDDIGGIKMVYMISGILYIVFAILAFLFLPKEVESSSTEEESIQIKESKGSLIEVLKNANVWLLGFFMLSCYSVIISGVNYLGTYTTQVLGVDVAVSSSLAIIRSYILTVVAGILGGVLADKFPSRLKFLRWVLVAVAISTITSIFISKIVMLSIVVSMLLAFLYFIIKSTYFSVMGESGIPRHLTGIASGFISFVAFAPDAYITMVMGSWLDQDIKSGFTKIFIWMTVWSVIAFVLNKVIEKRNLN